MLENHTFDNVGPFGNNIYVAFDPESREAAIFDVGFEPERVIAWVKQQGLTVRWLLATHAHYDHVAAMHTMQQAFPVPFALHPLDRPLLQNVALQGSMFGLPPVPVPGIGLELAEGQTIALGHETLEVIFTPGHAPGHVTFRNGDTLWSGDVLFSGSVGRTDLPGGSWDVLARSIREKLFPLGDDLRVLPGHGPETTLGRERRTNPYVGVNAMETPR